MNETRKYNNFIDWLKQNTALVMTNRVRLHKAVGELHSAICAMDHNQLEEFKEQFHSIAYLVDLWGAAEQMATPFQRSEE